MLLIKEEDVKALITWQDTFQAMEVALKSVSVDRANQKARVRTAIKNSQSALLTMPGYLEDDKFGGLGCKIISLFPNKTGSVSINAKILFWDEENGEIKAIIDGNEITAWRTAAATVIASKYILGYNITPRRPIKSMALLGAGEQAIAHLKAFTNMFLFEEIRVWNRTKKSAEKLVEDIRNNSVKFTICDTVKECTQDADIVTTTTASPTPLVFSDMLKPTAHINAIGVSSSSGPWEIDLDVYKKAHVFVDSYTYAKEELANFEAKGIKITGEIGELISGKITPNEDKITIFQSLGMAVEDCAMARLIYDLYVAKQSRIH